ncbi:DUF4262 domain-containing protein [Niallia taxi]|uniref:DUF4262 domain-containing protein n=1 Tax=Niallia taxi TaxID=2499688 RepID=UPI0015F750F4|nr:DUF4262 domain-containing protein [Niallia taxi]
MSKRDEDKEKFDKLQQQREWMEKYGWVYHYENFPGENQVANIHTHGFEENYNHMDFQIVLKYHPDLVQGIFNTLYYHVKRGKVYESGKYYSEVVSGYDVLMQTFEENGRELLRVILPDENGLFPQSPNCNPIYKLQTMPLPSYGGNNEGFVH